MNKILIMAILFLSGCASVKTISVNRRFDSLQKNCPIKVVSARPSSQEAEEMALLQLSGSSESLTEYIQDLKTQACELGGDMIFIPSLTVDAWSTTPVNALVPVFKSKNAQSVRTAEHK